MNGSVQLGYRPLVEYRQRARAKDYTRRVDRRKSALGSWIRMAPDTWIGEGLSTEECRPYERSLVESFVGLEAGERMGSVAWSVRAEASFGAWEGRNAKAHEIAGTGRRAGEHGVIGSSPIERGSAESRLEHRRIIPGEVRGQGDDGSRAALMESFGVRFNPDPGPSPFGPGGVPDMAGHRAWYGNYVGPGNTRADWEQDNLQPLSPVDQAAREHDKAYDHIAQKYGFSEGWDPQKRKYRKDDELFDVLTERVDIQRPQMHAEIIGADADLMWRSGWNMVTGLGSGEYSGGVRGIDKFLADALVTGIVGLVFGGVMIPTDVAFMGLGILYKATVWSLRELGLQHAMDVLSGGFEHAESVTVQGWKHAGGVISGGWKHVAGDIAGGWKAAGNVVGGGWKHLGGVISKSWVAGATDAGRRGVGDVLSSVAGVSVSVPRW
jgi:TM2 domain-containing membrane protein YozV